MAWLSERKNQGILVGALVLIAFGYYTVNQEPMDLRDPTTIAEENLNTLLDAARNREVSPFEELLSDQVTDDSGRSKDDLLKILRLLFFRHQSVYLNVLDMQSRETIDDQQVVVSFTMLMGEQAVTVEKGSFEVTFSREDTKWRVTAVKWGNGYGY